MPRLPRKASHLLRTAFFAPASLAAILLSLFAVWSTGAEEVANVFYSPSGIDFEILIPNEGATLTVTGPAKEPSIAFFEAGETAHFGVLDPQGETSPDGVYSFELRLVPELDESIRQELITARETGDMTLVNQLCDEGQIPQEAAIASGSFTIEGAQILDPYMEEEGEALASGVPTSSPASLQPAPSEPGETSSSSLENFSARDQVINDDLIVKKSMCVGFDCVHGESFGFDTIKLKENNLRIRFDDTSTTASFPKTDWQLTANESANGGRGKFSIDDISNGRTVFTVEAGAPSHSLYVDSSGDVGFGTSTPVLDLHLVDGESPTLRLQQDGTSGFKPQTWDVVGNEANFFVRDAGTNTLPFRIRPKAPTSSIMIAENGDVGVGTSGPQKPLHVRRVNGRAAALVEEASSTEAARTLLTLKNNGRVLLQMEDTSSNGKIWKLRTVEGQLNMDTDSGSGNELTLTQTGNLIILGTLTENSNREAKTNIEAVDPAAVLDRVAGLPINTWTYKKEQDVEHLGPMAQDFHDAFGLGASNLGITTYDTSGVALASIQALYRMVREQQEELQSKEAEIQALRQKNSSQMDELLRRLEALEQEQK